MLASSRVNRSLTRKTLILWLEITDIFLLVAVCSALNFCFGGGNMKAYLVYLPTLLLGAVLVGIKRGREEGFLLHFLRFHSSPKHLSSFSLAPQKSPVSKVLQRSAR